MEFMKKLKEKAKTAKRKIVLPESTEEKTLKATETIIKENLAEIILVGNEEKIKTSALKTGADISGAHIADPSKSPLLESYAETFFQIRKHKGVSPESSLEIMKDELYFGTMMVHTGEADGLVSGAVHSTADTVRPALQIIKTKPGLNVVSSCFIMIVPESDLGEKGMFVFADCAINIDPDSSQLAEIAVSSAETAKVLCNMEPKVAMLSFSTYGSAKHQHVDKVVDALKIVKEKFPDLEVDGDIQADAALISSIGKTKCPGSSIAGKANVLVFPELQSGNISYKLVERLAKAKAIGPILQGIAKPVNDLSRGCSVEDIVNLCVITSAQVS